MAAVDEETVTLEGLARTVDNLAHEVDNLAHEVRAGFNAVNERLDSIDRCLDDDLGPRLTGLQDAVKRIEDGLPQ